MSLLVVLAIGAGLGVTLVVLGLVPDQKPRDIEQALASLSGSAPRTSSGGWAHEVLRHRWVAAPVAGLAPDLKVAEVTAEQWFTKAVRSAALAVGGTVLFATFVGASLFVVAVGAGVGFAFGVWSEVRWLRFKARERRQGLVEVAQALLTMTTVGLHTAKPMSEIAVDGIDRIDGWAGRLLRRALWEGSNAEQLTVGESMRRFGKDVKSPPMRLFGETVAQGERLHVDPDAVVKRAEQLQVELNQRLVAEGGRQQEKIIVPIMAFAVVVMAITMLIPMGAALAQ